MSSAFYERKTTFVRVKCYSITSGFQKPLYLLDFSVSALLRKKINRIPSHVARARLSFLQEKPFNPSARCEAPEDHDEAQRARM
jgi:hypothetical protein